MPLTEVNRPALSAAARRAAVEALLAARFPLVRICHAVAVLASSASGPGIPEGAARVRALRAALDAAAAEAGLSDGPKASGIPAMNLPACPCARVVSAGNRLPIPASLVESARVSGSGLRILRFKPSGLKREPRYLAEGLMDLLRRDKLLGLYAITGKRPDSPVREFALFVPDPPPPETPGDEPGPDFLAGFPVRGRIRTLVGAGEDARPDLTGFDLIDGDPMEFRPESVPGEQFTPYGKPGPLRTVSGTRISAESAAPLRRDPRAGEYRNAAVLRAEIPDLLEVLRGREPRKSAEYLNRVLSRLASCAKAAGGTVDVCGGGGILAYWGAPASSGEDAQRAGRAALAMRRVVTALNRGRASSGLRPIRLHCALDAGPVLAAELGTPERVSYTVAGEALRRSAGFGHRNGPWGTDILVSEYAARLMGAGFLVRPMGNLEIGSDGAAVGIYALIGRTGDSSDPRNLEDLRRRIGTG